MRRNGPIGGDSDSDDYEDLARPDDLFLDEEEGRTADEVDSLVSSKTATTSTRSVAHHSISSPSGIPVLSRLQWCCRAFVLFVLVACIVLVVVDFTTTRFIVTSSKYFVGWVGKHPALGILAVVGIFTLATILFMPANVLTIGTGFAFHSAFGSYHKAVLLASIAVLFGSMMGSICSFLLGRYLFRTPVMNMASHYPMFRAIDKALGGNGLKIMFLLRLSPLIPYNVLDYLSGVTSIPLWKYSVALLGMLPGMILFASIGAAASSLSDGEKLLQTNRMVQVAAICGGLVFTIGGVAVASYYSKIELDKILKIDQEAQRNKESAAGDGGSTSKRLEMETECDDDDKTN